MFDLTVLLLTSIFFNTQLLIHVVRNGVIKTSLQFQWKSSENA